MMRAIAFKKIEYIPEVCTPWNKEDIKKVLDEFGVQYTESFTTITIGNTEYRKFLRAYKAEYMDKGLTPNMECFDNIPAENVYNVFNNAYLLRKPTMINAMKCVILDFEVIDQNI